MVLVDTSTWIHFLAKKGNYAEELDRLLAENEVAGHDLVYGELLVGDRGGRRKFLESYAQIYQAPVVPHSEVIRFVRERDLPGRGVGWIDMHLLASALVGRMKLWSLDPRLAAVAQGLGAAHEWAGSGTVTCSHG